MDRLDERDAVPRQCDWYLDIVGAYDNQHTDIRVTRLILHSKEETELGERGSESNCLGKPRRRRRTQHLKARSWLRRALFGACPKQLVAQGWAGLRRLVHDEK